jgi:predicted nucleic acid-binding protein
MTPVVVDASVLAAIVFGEPQGPALAADLDGASVFAPTLLKFELASVARKKARDDPRRSPLLVRALAGALGQRSGLNWRDVDHADVLLLARATGLTTYDASYLWLAASLGANLVTLDQRLARATETFV